MRPPIRYTSPSLEATELTAAPYRGKGLGCAVVYVIRRFDHGYNEAFGGWFIDCTCPFRDWIPELVWMIIERNAASMRNIARNQALTGESWPRSALGPRCLPN